MVRVMICSMPLASRVMRNSARIDGRRVPLRGQRGLTLIEVLVALSVGLLLLGGAASMMVSNKRVYEEQQMMSRLQENMRFAFDTLLYDIRMAGHVGCSDDPDRVQSKITVAPVEAYDRTAVAQAPEWYTISNRTVIDGTADRFLYSEWVSTGDRFNLNAQVLNTDAFAVRFLEPTGLELLTGMGSPDATLRVDANGVLEQDMALGIADCTDSELFIATGTLAQLRSGFIQHRIAGGKNASDQLRRVYAAGTPIYTLVSRAYIVYNGSRPHERSRLGGVPSLYRLQYSYEAADYVEELLIVGVEGMKIAFLEDGQATYKEASDATLDWDRISAVRLALLFRTETENYSLTQDTNTYTLLTQMVSPGVDHVRRRLFTTTVQIRNRIDS